MAVGGSKFLLEKTWKASAGSSTTFNTPGNIVIPYGRSNIVVTGRGGTGIGSGPSTIAGYNPSTPGTVTYNPISGGNFSFSYSPTPAYTEYNPPSGGNFAGGNPPSGGNYAGSNPPSGGNFAGGNPPSGGNYAGSNPPSGGNYAGSNPPSGGNFAGSNPAVPGNANYNSPSPGQTAAVYTQYICEPTGFGGFTVDAEIYNSVNGSDFNYVGFSNVCPAPAYNTVTYNSSPGNATGSYNPSTPGETIYNPVTPGNDAYNPLSPGNDNYNPVTPGTETYNPLTPGNDAYNPVTPGTATYNPISPGNGYFVPAEPGSSVYNPVSGGNFAGGNPAVPGNANYNVGSSPVPGTPTNVLGVTMPGGNPGQVASAVPPTTINRYQFPDGTTYPVTVPTGSYVTIQIS